MPVPATTGQLRTKVSDMQIGDYLSAAYSGATANGLGAVRGDVSFGDATNPNYGFPEIPLTGLTGAAGSTTGYFYFVKAEKGMLIADRVVHNSISWDVLNTGKVIQGLPWDAGNIIPTMTSNTAPSGVASSNKEHTNTSFSSWKAFNKNGAADAWSPVSGSTGWLQYEFASPTCIRQYTILGYQNNESYSPKTWKFMGSNDGVNFDILDAQSGVTGWTSNTKKAFRFANNSSYKMYRIDVTESGGITLYIAELEMMETVGTIRSLTGGVAYADASGNSSTTDQSKGAWPVNNEWDKYIVKSDLGGKITKDNDGVWHHDYSGSGAPFTWCQDTPALSLGAAANRVRRARNNGIPYITNNPSSAALTYIGFRPIFEYKEV